MKITKAKQSDIGMLLALMEEACNMEARLYYKKSESRPFKKAESEYRSLIKSKISSSSGVAYIAYENGEPAGFIFAYIEKGYLPFRYKRHGYIRNVYVRPAHRNAGIGQALLGKVFAWLRGKGINRVSLDTNTQNEGAKKLYRQLGFEDYFIYYIKNLR